MEFLLEGLSAFGSKLQYVIPHVIATETEMAGDRETGTLALGTELPK